MKENEVSQWRYLLQGDNAGVTEYAEIGVHRERQESPYHALLNALFPNKVILFLRIDGLHTEQAIERYYSCMEEFIRQTGLNPQPHDFSYGSAEEPVCVFIFDREDWENGKDAVMNIRAVLHPVRRWTSRFLSGRPLGSKKLGYDD